MTIEDMIEELVENYETAGYENFYERVLKDKSDAEIKLMYENFIKWTNELEAEYQKEKAEYLSNKENNN